MGMARMLRGRSRLIVGLGSVVGVLVLAAPAMVLASGARRVAHPGALRTVPVLRVAGGRVRSRRARLFTPVSATSLARGARAGRAAAVKGSGSEIPGLRTATSDTFAAGRGAAGDEDLSVRGQLPRSDRPAGADR